MTPHYAIPPVVRGNVKQVLLHIWKGGQHRATIEIPEEQWPYQKNNMTAWLQGIFKVSYDREALKAYRIALGKPVSFIYKAEGPAPQVGTSWFTYEFEGWKLELVITTEHYNKKYHEKIKAGLHERQPRRYATAPQPKYYTHSGKVKAPLKEADGKWIEKEYSTLLAFQAEHPDAAFWQADFQFINDAPKES